MNDQPRQTDSRMEGLLRHWGRQEALQQAGESLPPMRAPRRRLVLPTVLAAAAVVLLVIGVAGFLAPSLRGRKNLAQTGVHPAEGPQPKRTVPGAEPPDQALRQTQEALAQMAQRLADVELTLKQELRDTRSQMQRLREDLAAASTELAALKAREGQTFGDLQAVYLAAAAPGLRGLEARQAAAREHRMLARLVALRSEVPDPQTEQLLDRLEVLLTRLELLEPGDPQVAKGFADVVTASDIPRRIDDALGTVPQADLRAWLVEARIILAGVDHAG